MAINENSRVWDGVYATFAEAAGDDTVFEEAVWLNKIVERARYQLSRSSGRAAIPSVAVTSDYALPFVAALVAQRDKQLCILDFGGGMGTSYLPLIKILPPDQPIKFVIVENRSVCSAGAEIFSDDSRVAFRESVPESGDGYDIIHCGSSLHYVDDWQGLLDSFSALQPEYLLFADLPAADNISFVTSQLFHGKRIPVHFWSYREFVEAVEVRGFELAFQSRYIGHYLENDANVPTNHFDATHQLQYFCQLVFRRTRLSTDGNCQQGRRA